MNEQELMPNCPTCGQYETVGKSYAPYKGSHFCYNFNGGCDKWFTPVNDNARRADETLDSLVDAAVAFPTERSEELLSDIEPIAEEQQGEPEATPFDCHCGLASTVLFPYRTLNPEFLRLMEEIGLYGAEKYGNESMDAKFKRGDFSRTERTTDKAITEHSINHLFDFDEGILHDHFGTRKHQLAASAFNSMMKYIFFINECKKEVA